MKTIRMGSSPLAYAPGIIRWAMSGWLFPADRKAILNVLNSWPTGLSDKDWHRVMIGEVPFSIEGETVVFNI